MKAKMIAMAMAMVFAFLACEEADETDSGMVLCEVKEGEFKEFEEETINSCDDKDGDYDPWWTDCDDYNPRRSSHYFEVANNYVDDNCNGEVDEFDVEEDTEDDDTCWVWVGTKKTKDYDCDGEPW